MTSDAKTVRGLSIAIVILSAISVLFVLICFAGLAFVGAFANDPGFLSALNNELQSTAQSSSYFDDDYEYYAMLGSMDASTLVHAFIGIGGVALGLLLACIVVSLVSGILGIKNCDRRAKLGMTFGWMIAGAVLSLLSGRFITMALTIIAAVYVNKLRKAPEQPIPAQGAQGYPGQPYPYNPAFYQQQPTNPEQPYGQQPAGQSAQPYGYGQQPGANPAQPYGQSPAGQQPENPNVQPLTPQQPTGSAQPYGQQPRTDEQPIAKLNGEPYDLGKPNAPVASDDTGNQKSHDLGER